MTVVDDVKSRLEILEVISHYVPLQRSGRSYKANCPFHQEKTPSFYVFPDRRTWRCFGACASGGDVFSFVMRAENLEFAEALKRLAQQAGVALPNRERRAAQQVAFQVNEAARGYFQRRLASPQGKGARAYLELRGLTPETISKFELGLSPGDGESLKNYLVQQGFSLEHLALAGVVTSGENGRYRDLFRGRLMLPIRNAQGELGGFGGRTLDESTPKYLNSPRSPTFDKGRILYALYLAKESAQQQGIVIVEGYTDAIMAHQHGFHNVVASMGTALTEHQVAQVRRITGNATMALDPDAAGQQATLRSLETSWRVLEARDAGGPRIEPNVVILPDGMDPDQVIRNAPQKWADLVSAPVPLFQYMLDAHSASLDLRTAEGKTQLVEKMWPLVRDAQEPFRQDHYVQELATRLGVTAETLQASVGRPYGARRNRGSVSPARVASSSAFAKLDHDPIEDYGLALLLQYPELGALGDELQPEYFRRMENREIFCHWTRCSQEDEAAALERLQSSIDEELSGHLESLVHKPLPPMERNQKVLAFQDTVRRLEERYLRDLKAEEELRFSEAPPDDLAETNEQVLSVNERIKRNQIMRNPLAQNGPHRR